MNTRTILCLLLAFLGAFTLANANDSDQVISLESLLKEMIDRSELTRTPNPAYLGKSASSYDRESKVNNPDDGLYVEKDGRDWGKGWFANRDFAQYIREEINDGRNETVLMEDTGPGAIVRWWAPSEKKRVKWSPSTGKDIIRIYLDGSSSPVIEMRPDELVGSNKLVPYPLSFMASNDEADEKWRGRNLYLPIPYAKSCKVTWEGTPFYYQIGYRSYPEGTKVKSFSMDQLESSEETIKRVAEKLTTGSAQTGIKSFMKTEAVLAPEQSTHIEVD
ncbi:hypothetical protein BVX97_05025, partial [bacterium E08(2017)]